MGSSKKQTVGYRYSMGLHFGLCHGPVDEMNQIKGADRAAWTGAITDNATINIDAPELYGGDKKEGGIQGALDVLMGAPSQGLNSYLQAFLGSNIPAFRGILSAVWRGGLVASNNPYIKPWAFRVFRALKGWDGGTPWNPTRAVIPYPSVVSEAVFNEQFNSLANWTQVAGTAGDFTISSNRLRAQPGPTTFSTLEAPVPSGILKSIDVDFTLLTIAPDDGGVLFFRRADGSIAFTFNIAREVASDALRRPNVSAETVSGYVGTPMGTAQVGLNTLYHFRAEFDYSANEISCLITQGGSNFAAVTIPMGLNTNVDKMQFGVENGSGGGTALYDNLSIVTQQVEYFNGMNPAHIIYECLTNRDWGMGYPTSSIDDDSFSAAADALFGENFGLCMLWNRQQELQGFIKIVCDHIGGNLYVNPSTGKFALKLIRNDYEIEDLPIFGPANLVSVDNYQRQAWGETTNEVTVIYRDVVTNRDGGVTVQDLANIQTQGGVVAASRQYPGVPNAPLAQRVALRDLNIVSTPIATAQLQAKRSAWNVVPGGVFRLQWPDLEIEDVVYRVLEVNGGTLQNGMISIKVAEDVFGLPEASYVGDQPGEWTDPSNEPAPAPASQLLEAPYWDLARSLSAADLDYLDPLSGYLETLASRPSPDALSYEINARTGSADFTDVGVGEFCPTATLLAAADRTDADTVIAFENGERVDSVAVGGYGVLGGEVVGIKAIDLVLGTVTISRGLLDTTPAAHAAGARLWFADGFQGSDQTEYADGETVDVKLLPRTGRGELPIDAAPADSITMNQRHNRPYPPGLFRVNGLQYPPTILDVPLAASWAHRDRLQQTAFLVEQGEANIGPEAGTTYTVRLYDTADESLLDEQTGIAGTTWTGPDLAGTYELRLEVYAVRDALESWQAQTHTFSYSNGARFTEGGDERETESGEIRSME